MESPVSGNDTGQRTETNKFKTHQNNTEMGKKIIGVISFAAIAVAAGWNYQQNTNEVDFSDLTIANIEALARNEGEGIFPACQKNKGSGDYAYIPFCVDGTCKSNTWEQKGKLDVNYCSE